MNDNQEDLFTKFRANKKSDSTPIKPKISYIERILNIFINIYNFFIWIKNKINTLFSSCSILTQLTIFLIPLSIICLLSIFFIHFYFYNDLYIFNFNKVIKEEFLDNYITEMDDIHSEINGFIIKENYLDIEDQTFLEVYYRELALIGILDNPNKKIIPDISKNSETLYLLFDNIAQLLDTRDIFTIPKEKAKKYIDDRNEDSLGELAKLYYYMIPLMGNGAFYMNVVINKTFFVAYEFDENRKVKNKELFFSIPRNKASFNENDNFTPSNYLLNPLINGGHYDNYKKVNNSYYNDNWFMKQDNLFREKVNLTEKGYIETSLAHLNNENDGNINKSVIITSQQYINRNEKYYIINIVLFLQENFMDENENGYSIFIVKNEPDFPNNIENEKYSDNETYVLLKSDNIEYSLTYIDYQYFHNGLYDKNYSFYQNGIFIDSFNLNYLYNPLEYYSTVENYDVDLKYLTALYLYKSFFQTTNYSIIRKRREEIYLYNFNDEEKVKSICGNINFQLYKNYKNNSGINCWNKENIFYYNENNFQNKSMIDTISKYPYCSCLPLYCLENFESIDNDFNNINLASKINLPNKCQTIYKYYKHENENEDNIIDQKTHISSKYIYNKIASNINIPNNEYVKIELDNLIQIPGYYLLIITQIKSSTEFFIYYFVVLLTQMEIIILLLGVIFLTSIICIIIVYINLRRYSLIINEFVQKYELYVFHSHNGKIDIFNKEDNYENNKIEGLNKYNNFSDKDIFNINENNLLDDLFSLFCKHYKISRKYLEKYYSKQKHKTKNQLKIKMMSEKNELFKLLSMFSVYASTFKLNLSLDFKMFNYTKIIKKYDKYILQVSDIDNNKQARLTRNILFELLSTENISDYGLVTNLNFKYVSNIKAESKCNSIQNAIFINSIYKRLGKNQELDENDIYDAFLSIKNGEEKKNLKLILKKKSELLEFFKNKFESDDYIIFNKIESSFNFFLVNAYYKYLKQISLENNY